TRLLLIWGDVEEQRLYDFVTRDVITRHLSCDEICLETWYSCSLWIVKSVMESRVYHQWIPRRKFAIRLANKPIRVAWCQERLSWSYEDWLPVLWTDKSTFSTVGFGNRPRVTRKASEEYYTDCIDETFESGRQTKMIWRGFC